VGEGEIRQDLKFHSRHDLHEVESQDEGILGRIIVGQDETVPIGAVVAFLLKPGETADAIPAGPPPATAEEAVKEAQELGIAEPDPTYDIQGIDTAAKVVILANALLGKDASYKDVSVTGIEDVTLESIKLAEQHGYVVKLVGDVEKLEVSPRLVAKGDPLNVKGSLNAITFKTDLAGDITLVGAGAGPKETSSALLADLMNIVNARELSA